VRGFFFPIRVTDFGRKGHGFRTRGTSRILDGLHACLTNAQLRGEGSPERRKPYRLATVSWWGCCLVLSPSRVSVGTQATWGRRGRRCTRCIPPTLQSPRVYSVRGFFLKEQLS
jgi:hypothetical protein